MAEREREPRILLVVARDRPELFEYFRRGFAGMEGEIRVILDRRAARSQPPGTERRERQDTSQELQQRGFIMIHLL